MTGPVGRSAAEVAADEAANAYYEAEAQGIAYMPGGNAREGTGDTRLLLWPVPDPQLNVVRVGHQRDLGEVEAFARELSATGLPWGIQARGDVDPDLRELAARYGRTDTSTKPLLRWDAGSQPARPGALPDGAAVRKVPGQESDVFVAVLAAGFGIPEDVVRNMFAPAVLDAPGITAFVLVHHGEAVATQLNVLTGGYVGIFSVSVPPGHRGNGYARALLAACLADAIDHGARHAVSTNSPMSRPLFESMGFRRAETWTCLIPAA